MNIMVDSRLSKLTDIIDKSHKVTLINVENIGNVSSNLDEDSDIITERIYSKCVDNNVELVVSTEIICDGLERLDINTIALDAK